MNPLAVKLAQGRLRNAIRALDDLRETTDYDTFSDHWFSFLTAWKAIYTVLEQGAKDSPQSRQWFGGKKAERRSDELLQYLFEARNDEEHGLGQSVAHTDKHFSTFKVRDGEPAFWLDSASFRLDRSGPIMISDPRIEMLRKVVPGPYLISVKARGNRTIEPPKMHLGNDLEDSPLAAATQALEYAKRLVDEAANL